MDPATTSAFRVVTMFYPEAHGLMKARIKVRFSTPAYQRVPSSTSALLP
ncbi:MAG: hypothetical protein ACFCVD_13030 [Nodosilinea sp.]